MSQFDAHEPANAFGCHVWTGKLDRHGRPIVWRGARPSSAHRVAYEASVGPIADGFELDHLCRNKLCVRVAHLEPVTRSENERRKSWRYRARRALCPRGHAFATTAIVTPDGGRVCRTCNQEQP